MLTAAILSLALCSGHSQWQQFADSAGAYTVTDDSGKQVFAEGSPPALFHIRAEPVLQGREILEMNAGEATAVRVECHIASGPLQCVDTEERSSFTRTAIIERGKTAYVLQCLSPEPLRKGDVCDTIFRSIHIKIATHKPKTR